MKPFPSAQPAQQPLWQRDMRFWFRLSLIAYLLCWAGTAQADELVALSPEPVKVKQETGVELLPPPTPLEMPPVVDPAVPEPLELTPPEPAEAAPSPVAKGEPAGPTWTMLVTPGASSQASVTESPRLITFKFDSETGKQLGEPEEERIGLAAAVQQQTPRTADSDEKNCPVPAGHFTAHPVSENYKQIYNSIPYSRAEYLANPGYRHEATMELLFGEQRPVTIHKHDTPRRIYNLPPIHEDPPRAFAPAGPWNWSGPAYSPAGYFPARYPFWTPNSTYRRYPTLYGPLFNSHYRPLTRPWGY